MANFNFESKLLCAMDAKIRTSCQYMENRIRPSKNYPDPTIEKLPRSDTKKTKPNLRKQPGIGRLLRYFESRCSDRIRI